MPYLSWQWLASRGDLDPSIYRVFSFFFRMPARAIYEIWAHKDYYAPHRDDPALPLFSRVLGLLEQLPALIVVEERSEDYRLDKRPSLEKLETDLERGIDLWRILYNRHREGHPNTRSFYEAATHWDAFNKDAYRREAYIWDIIDGLIKWED